MSRYPDYLTIPLKVRTGDAIRHSKSVSLGSMEAFVDDAAATYNAHGAYSRIDAFDRMVILPDVFQVRLLTMAEWEAVNWQ